MNLKRFLATLAWWALAAQGAVAGSSGGPAAPAPPIDLNAAGGPQLQTLPGVGPAVAQRILAERRRGPFRDWEDLSDRVRGVGPARIAQWSAAGHVLGPGRGAPGASGRPGSATSTAAARNPGNSAPRNAAGDSARNGAGNAPRTAASPALSTSRGRHQGVIVEKPEPRPAKP